MKRAGLQLSDTATTIQVCDGGRQVQNGPYADIKQHSSGFSTLSTLPPSTPQGRPQRLDQAGGNSGWMGHHLPALWAPGRPLAHGVEPRTRGTRCLRPRNRVVRKRGDV